MNSCIHTGRSSFNSGKTRSNPTLGNARGNDFSWAKTEKDRIKPNNNAKLLENIAANSFASEKFTRNDFSLLHEDVLRRRSRWSVNLRSSSVSSRCFSCSTNQMWFSSQNRKRKLSKSGAQTQVQGVLSFG